MTGEFQSLKMEFLESLDKNPIWVLASGGSGRISARSIAIVHIGTDIYFLTTKNLIKYSQIKSNPRVALCQGGISVEGEAQERGRWDEPRNHEARAVYMQTHPKAFGRYGNLDNCIVFVVQPKIVMFWKYIDGEPHLSFLDLVKSTGETIEYSDERPLSWA